MKYNYLPHHNNNSLASKVLFQLGLFLSTFFRKAVDFLVPCDTHSSIRQSNKDDQQLQFHHIFSHSIGMGLFYPTMTLLFSLILSGCSGLNPEAIVSDAILAPIHIGLYGTVAPQTQTAEHIQIARKRLNEWEDVKSTNNLNNIYNFLDRNSGLAINWVNENALPSDIRSDVQNLKEEYAKLVDEADRFTQLKQLSATVKSNNSIDNILALKEFIAIHNKEERPPEKMEYSIGNVFSIEMEPNSKKGKGVPNIPLFKEELSRESTNNSIQAALAKDSVRVNEATEKRVLNFLYNHPDDAIVAQFKQQIANGYRESAQRSQSFQDYLNAFKWSGDRDDVEKAMSLTKTPAEKAEVELALVRFVESKQPFESVFSLEQIANNTPSAVERAGVNFIFEAVAIASVKDVQVTFKLSKRKDAKVPLKHLGYRVKVKFILKKEYHTKGKVWFIDSESNDTYSVNREVVFSLKQGEWSDTQTVHFGGMDQHVGGGMPFNLVKIDVTLKNVNIETQLIDIEKLE